MESAILKADVVYRAVIIKVAQIALLTDFNALPVVCRVFGAVNVYVTVVAAVFTVRLSAPEVAFIGKVGFLKGHFADK